MPLVAWTGGRSGWFAAPPAEAWRTRYDHDRAASPPCSTASPPTGSTRSGTASTAGAPSSTELTDLPKALRARLAEQPAPRAAPGGRVGSRRRRHREVAVATLDGGARSRRCSCTTATAPRCASAPRPAAPWPAGSAPPGRPASSATSPSGEIVEQVVRARRPRHAAAAAVQRRVHGHGRAPGQLRPHLGGGRAAARRHRAVGPPPHPLDRRRRARHPPAGRRGPARSTWPCRCTRPTTRCATSWCRSTAATRWPCSMEACARLPRRQEPPALLRVGADRRRQRPAVRRRASWPRIARPLRAHVNLIPLNPTPGYADAGHAAGRRAGLPRPAPRRSGVNATVRQQPRHRHRRGVRPAAGRPRCGPAGAPHRPAVTVRTTLPVFCSVST